MERHEATELLRQLITLEVVLPSLVFLEKTKHHRFDLVLKPDCDTQALKEFVSKRGMIAKEDNMRGYFIISKPSL